MKHLTLAKPYADAAFQFAKEKKQIESWRHFLATMAQVFSDKEMQNLLKNPKLSIETLLDILMTQFKESTNYMRNFLRLLATNKRLFALPEVYDLFEQAYQKDAHIKEVKLTFAKEPSKEELALLQPALKQKFGNDIKESIHINTDLLSGVIIESDDYVIDASLKGQLAALKNDLMRP